MNGVGRLIKNELIKVFSQVSWKVISVLILVLAIVSPIMNNLADEFYGVSDGYYYMMSEEASEGSIEKEFFRTLSDIESFFAECGINMDNWRYEAYYNEYEQLSIMVKGLELVLEGCSINSVFDWFYFDSISYENDENGNMTVTYYDDETGEVVPFTSELAEELYAEKKPELDSLSEEIKNGSAADYAQTYITLLEMQIAIKETELAEAKAAYEEDDTNVFNYLAAAFDLNAARVSLDVWDEVKKSDRDNESWLITTAQQTFRYTELAEELSYTDKASFERDAEAVKQYETYDNYIRVMEKSYYDNVAALEILRHSAVTKNPLPDIISDSVKGTVNESVVSNASTVLFFCTILAATIVASEHTAGTIRLLVIRPRARWKILLSKLACTVIYGLVMFALSSVLSIIVNVIIHGAGDLTLPYLLYRNSAVTEVSPIVYIIVRTIILSLPSILFVSVAFLLSVVMRKVVFSVALPLLASMFGSVASTLCLILMEKMTFLKWTVVPYFSIENFLLDPVAKTSGYSFADTTALGLSLERGVVILLVHIAVVVAISFIVFKRQQIKN